MLLRFFTAAVAGPALIYAGAKFPGTAGAKVALMSTGAVLIGTQLWQLDEEARPALTNGLDDLSRRLVDRDFGVGG